jgi:hypothetical protein
MMAGDWMGQAEKKVHSLNGEPKLLSVWLTMSFLYVSYCFMNYVITRMFHFMIMFTNPKPPSNPSDPTTIQCLLSQGLLQQEPLEGPKAGVKRFVRFGKNAGFQPLMLHVYIYIFSFIPFTVYLTSHCVCLVWFLGWLIGIVTTGISQRPSLFPSNRLIHRG